MPSSKIQGPLGKVWIAATLGESKVSKSFATTAKIHLLCQNIEQPAAPFALRLSSALMLGVVRVFSRKSTIILADTTSVLNAIIRYNTQSAAKSSGKKRSRAAAQLENGQHADINLQDGEDQPRFDLITLPIKKKRKSAGKAAQSNALGALSKSAGSLSHGFLSNGSFMMADPSFDDTAEIDVLTAMQSVFPTVVLPRLGEHLPSGLNSPTSVHNLGSHRKMLYSARDQDITLSQPMGQLDGMGFDMFDEDLHGSIRSDPMSNMENSRPLWMSEFQGSGNAHGNGSISNGHSRSLGSIGNCAVSPVPSVALGIEPLELEPLDIHPRYPAPAMSAKKKTKKLARVNSVSTPSSEEPSRNHMTPDRNPRAKRVVLLPLASSSGKKRRSAAQRMDPVTEMSPSQIRGCLNDTTDIVRVDFEERKVGSGRKGRKASKEHLAFAVPGFLTSFSKDITNLWQDMTLPPFVAMEDRETLEAASVPRTRNGYTTGGGAATTTGRNQFPEDIVFEEQDEIMAVIDSNVVVRNEKNDSSVEVDRANSGPRVPSIDQLSVPSHSVEGKTHSGGNDSGHNIGARGHHHDVLDKVSAPFRPTMIRILLSGSPMLTIFLDTACLSFLSMVWTEGYCFRP